MSGEQADVRTILDDDAAMITWLVSVAKETPDVYVRPPPGGVRVESRLRDDLGIDSIGRVCVFYALADRLSTDADEAVASTWTTVGDVLAFIRAAARG